MVTLQRALSSWCRKHDANIRRVMATGEGIISVRWKMQSRHTRHNGRGRGKGRIRCMAARRLLQ